MKGNEDRDVDACSEKMTYKNELEKSGLVDLDKALFPAVDFVNTDLIYVLLMMKLAKFNDFGEDYGVDLTHGNLHPVLLIDVFQHAFNEIYVHSDRFLDIECLTISTFQLESNTALLLSSGRGIRHGAR